MPKPSKTRPVTPPRIIHVQGADPPPGLILYTDRLTLADELVPLVFPKSDGDLPEGAYLDHVETRAGPRFDQFHLIVRGPALSLMDETLRRLYLVPPSYDTRTTAEQALERQRRYEEESEKWWTTYHPVLGMSPRKRLATPGWKKQQNGYFTWAGSDPHDFHSPVQWKQLSKYNSVNDEVEYYLNRGLSLDDAVRAAIAMDWAEIRAAILNAANFDAIGMEILERQMMLDDANLYRAITSELNADRAAVEAALRAL